MRLGTMWHVPLRTSLIFEKLHWIVNTRYRPGTVSFSTRRVPELPQEVLETSRPVYSEDQRPCRLKHFPSLLFRTELNKNQRELFEPSNMRTSFLEGGVNSHLTRHFHADVASVSGRWWPEKRRDDKIYLCGTSWRYLYMDYTPSPF